MLKFYAFFNDLIINSKIKVVAYASSYVAGARLIVAYIHAPSYQSPLRSQKMARKDWNINFKIECRLFGAGPADIV